MMSLSLSDAAAIRAGGQAYQKEFVRSDICLDFELVINYIMSSRGGAYDEGGHHLRSV